MDPNTSKVDTTNSRLTSGLTHGMHRLGSYAGRSLGAGGGGIMPMPLSMLPDDTLAQPVGSGALRPARGRPNPAPWSV